MITIKMKKKMDLSDLWRFLSWIKMETLLEKSLKSTTSMTMYLLLSARRWALDSLTMLQELIEIKVASVEFLPKPIEKVLLPIFIS